VRLRDELLNGEIFYTLREAQIIIESWRPLQHGQTARIARTNRQLRRCSCQPSPRGPLRYADRLCRPCWRNRQP
jgi:hypothetical protein